MDFLGEYVEWDLVYTVKNNDYKKQLVFVKYEVKVYFL